VRAALTDSARAFGTAMPWVASRWSPQEEGGDVQKDVAPESALVRPSVMMGGRTGGMFGRRRL
jgi:hypothetical protein